MTTRYKYNSAGGRKKQEGKPPAKPKRVSSQLARAWFHALELFVNIEMCGYWFCGGYRRPDGTYAAGKEPGPRFSITKQQWDLWAQWRQRPGADLRYADGRPFDARHVHAGKLTPIKVHEMIHDGSKRYYTSGAFGYALLMIDLDAHEPEWQDDIEELLRDIVGLVGAANVFVVKSGRGYNVFVKVAYGTGGGALAYNSLLDRLQGALKKLTAARKCTVEAKGKAGDRSHYGLLAKLPCWGEAAERLDEFMALAVKDFAWLTGLVERLEKRAANAKPAAAKERKRPKVGSHTGTTVAPEELAEAAEALPLFRPMSYYLMTMRTDCRGKEHGLRALDFAIALAVLSVATKHKRGPELPQKFIKLLWQQMFKDELVGRQWNDSRWAVIWRTLADCGFIEVKDDTYWFYADGSAKGKAMEWSLRPEFSFYNLRQQRQTQEEEKRGVIAVGTFTPPPYVPGLYRPTRLPAPGEEVFWRPPGPLPPDYEAVLDSVMGTACAWGD